MMLEGIKPSVAHAGVHEATKHQHNEANNSKSTTTTFKILLTCDLPNERPLIHLANEIAVDDVHEHLRSQYGAIVGHLLSGWPKAQTRRSNFAA